MNGRYADFVRSQTAPTRTPLVPELTLYLATEVTPLWEATEAEMSENGLPPPFWAFAWPGGQALARLILDRPECVRGKPVLDFAAGCGVGALAAAKSGATTVTASEIDPFAAAAIRLNAEANGLTVDVTLDDVLAAPPPASGVILAGDVCYERPMAERVFAWLTQAAKKGTEVLLADPGRAYLPKSGLAELARYEVPTLLDVESRASMNPVVYRLALP